MNESSGGFSPRPTEAALLRIASTVVGVLLVLESLMMGLAGVFVAIIGGLVSALAFGVSGGSATDAQVTQTFGVIAISLASPFVVAAALGVGGVLLLLRKRGRVVIAAGIFAIVAQIAFHWLTEERFHAAELVPCAVHLLAIALGFASVRPLLRPPHPRDSGGVK